MAIPAERAPSHPRRTAILDLLASADRASDKQIAEAVGLAPATAAYHLRVLLDADMVERVGTFFERGAARRIYATVAGR
jgi:DNA-binding transcriptional ArsR family regulator